MKSISVLLMLVFLSSCTDMDDSVDYKIRGDNFKYWILIWCGSQNDENLHRFSEQNAIRLFYFDRNNKTYRATRYNFDCERLAFDHEFLQDVVTSNSWHLKDQKTILIENREYGIKALTKDMMLLYDSLNTREFLYIEAPDSLIPKVNRKILFDK